MTTDQQSTNTAGWGHLHALLKLVVIGILLPGVLTTFLGLLDPEATIGQAFTSGVTFSAVLLVMAAVIFVNLILFSLLFDDLEANHSWVPVVVPPLFFVVVIAEVYGLFYLASLLG